MPRLAFFISGRGSNMAAVLDKIRTGHLKAEAGLVFSDKSDAPGIEIATTRGISAFSYSPRAYKDKAGYETAVSDLLRKHQISHIVCAGYLRLIGPVLLEAFPMKIFNVHPSLLPAFPGLKAQKQALDYGVQITGCTFHLVDAQMDTGPILGQVEVPVRPDDTEVTLSRRILAAEHEHYWRAIARALAGFRLDGRRVVFTGDSG